MKVRGFAFLLLVALTVAGCAVTKNYQVPQADLPKDWRQRSAQESATQSVGPKVNLDSWWQSFGDPALDQLIAEATAANLDLRIASGRLLEARARLKGAAAAQMPVVGASGKVLHQRQSKNGPQGSMPQAKLEGEFFESGFDANWELDLFGFVRQGVAVAAADVEAAEEARRDVLVSLLAEVGRNYIQLRSQQQRLALTEKNLAAQQETLALVRVRFDSGLTTDLDVARAEALVSSTRAQIPAFEMQIEQLIYRLAILTGRQPVALLPELNKVAPQPAQPIAAGIPLGLPSELLRQRPDIRAAERQLAAATLRQGVAQADLYPHFYLTGAAGLQSVEAGDFFTSSSRLFSIGPIVRWNVFDFGRIRANIAVQDARVEQLLATYEKSILTALTDVESSLVALDKELVRQQALSDTVNASKRAVTTSHDLFRQGLSSYFSVLDSERQLLGAEDQLAISQAAVLLNRIGLYKALGGGWSE